ncbi:MAG: hypothetical protein OXI52_08540 [Caldilineaceae bacterium]|nr:hypothetical protein [Caldilineaceae bacterium]
MKRTAILIAVFALAACVPIQPDALQTPKPRAKGGLEELARVFAKMDQSGPSDYLDRLLEFEACLLPLLGSEFEKEFSDEERVVLVMHTLSTFMTGTMFPEDYQRQVEMVDEGLVDRQLYHFLFLSVEFCRSMD